MSTLELPPGLAWRPATPEDASAVLRLIEIAEDHYDGAVEVDAADIESDFQRVGFDLARDCVIVFDGDEAVSWSNVHRERAEADVRPTHQGRGIGTALLRWSEERVRELGGAKVSQTVTDNNGDAPPLFRANGYQTDGTSWILQISFEEPPPGQPMPDGIAIRPYTEGDAHDAYRVVDDAFNEWEGRTSIGFDEWRVSVIDHQAFSRELSRLAFEGDELVGAALAFVYATEEEGWIHQVATKATHRHRGIARALLYETFRAFYERGKANCGLSTDSRTGALSLYERVGMHVRRSYTKYAKPLA
ncbi:MAG TPA: GNAT family N-acetyltransferase [Actinomycetota bacterium]|nr:GNAT family N-acetyltransferase [Actinomycetota bacterium]